MVIASDRANVNEDVNADCLNLRLMHARPLGGAAVQSPTWTRRVPAVGGLGRHLQSRVDRQATDHAFVLAVLFPGLGCHSDAGHRNFRGCDRDLAGQSLVVGVALNANFDVDAAANANVVGVGTDQSEATAGAAEFGCDFGCDFGRELEFAVEGQNSHLFQSRVCQENLTSVVLPSEVKVTAVAVD